MREHTVDPGEGARELDRRRLRRPPNCEVTLTGNVSSRRWLPPTLMSVRYTALAPFAIALAWASTGSIRSPL